MTYRGSYCDIDELVVEDKHGKEMVRAKTTKSHKGLYVMGGNEFRDAKIQRLISQISWMDQGSVKATR